MYNHIIIFDGKTSALSIYFFTSMLRADWMHVFKIIINPHTVLVREIIVSSMEIAVSAFELGNSGPISCLLNL